MFLFSFKAIVQFRKIFVFNHYMRNNSLDALKHKLADSIIRVIMLVELLHHEKDEQFKTSHFFSIFL